MVIQTHLLHDQAVHQMRPGIVPHDQTMEEILEGLDKLQGPVVSIQSELERYQKTRMGMNKEKI